MLMRIDQKLLILFGLSLFSTLQSAENNELRKASMKVYCNEQVPYGKPTPIVISMKVLPVKTTIIVSLSTSTYLLAFFEVGNESGKMSPKWKTTSSISKQLSLLGIRKRPDKWQYEEGFWTNLTGTFWTTSDKFLTLLGRSKWLSEKQEVKEILPIEVNLPPHCTLQLAIPECSRLEPPRKILITRGFHVRTIFLEKCNLTIEEAIYNWSLSDAAGLTQFASYSTDRPLLKVRQYSWRFTASQELLRDFYLLQVEGKFEGTFCAARCYLKVEMGSVKAIISGGRHKRSSSKDILWMNGSMSYDFSKSPSEKQFSTYVWDCDSDYDENNKFCRQNISSEAAFSIPANSLKKGCTYVFQLKVSRDYNPKITSQIYQDVVIITRKVLQVKIECLKNCWRDFFTSNSQVHLKAVCLNCGKQNVARQWTIDGQSLFITNEIIIDIQAETNRTRIMLLMAAEDGRYGRDTKTLVRNFGPSGGECSISPWEGQEAITNFEPCCQSFISDNPPIEYYFYAGTVLLDSCLDCSCGFRLPVTSSVQVLACDVLFACHSTMIKVKIDPLKGIPTQPTDLQEYMNSSSNSIVKLLEERLFSSYLQAVNSIASHIRLADSAIILLHGFRDIQPLTQSSLSNLAKLTQTIALRLPTSDPETQELVIMVVSKLNDNFQEVITNRDAEDMTKRPLIGTFLACLRVYVILQKMAEKAPRPPYSIYDRFYRAYLAGSLDQDFVDKLYLEMPKFRTSPWNWLNITWEMYRLKKLLKLVRFNPKTKVQLPPDSVVINRCLKTHPKNTLVVNTSDYLHTVFLSMDLLGEVFGKNGKEICYQVISLQRALNWWYPDEKRPTSRMLTVRLVDRHEKRHTTDFHLQHSLLRYTSNMTISDLPAANDNDARGDGVGQLVDGDDPNEMHAGRYIRVVRHGHLKSLQSVRLYRIILDEQTVMAVHFIASTHRLQVKLKLEEKPIWQEISRARCTVPALSENTTILIRNNCPRPKRAYMALRVWSTLPIRSSPNTSLPDGPAFYTFALQIRSCAVWMYNAEPDLQKWTQVGCSPTMDISVAKELRCICGVLGTYTSYVHYTPPIRVSIGSFAEPKINREIIYTYMGMLIFILVSIYWLFRYRNDAPSKTIFIQMPDDDGVKDDGELHDFLVKLHTGGRVNSETTASVTLVILTTKEIRRKIRVQQDPESTFLNQNSTLHVFLRSREIRLPTKLMIYHDNFGRYPSWYLRSIEVNDIQTRETQVFLIKQWITNKVLILQSPHLHRWGEILRLENCRKRFKLHMEMLCVNWALWQPLTGSWRESNHYQNISRAKRYCVFVTKGIVAYTCCAIYFKPTTIESLQLDRDNFFSSKDLIALVLFVTATDAFCQLLFKLIAKHVS